MNTPYPLVVAALLACSACSRTDDAGAERAGFTTVTAASVAPVPESDFQIARRVESALASDPAISRAARNVHVDVTEQVVSLLGSVDDISAKAAVGAAAEGVPRTGGTLNKVEISPSRNEHDIESDENIAYSLQRSLAADPAVSMDADHVTIEVVLGVVWLRGRTGSAGTAAAVERIVERTPGVVTVWNELSPRR